MRVLALLLVATLAISQGALSEVRLRRSEEGIFSLKDEVDAVLSDATDNSDKFAKVAKSMEGVLPKTTLDATASDFTTISDSVSPVPKTNADSLYTAVREDEKRVVDASTTAQAAQTAVDQVRTRVHHALTRLMKIKDNVMGVKARVDKLDKKVDDTFDELDGIRDDHSDALQAEVDKYQARIDNLGDKLPEISSSVKKVTDKLAAASGVLGHLTKSGELNGKTPFFRWNIISTYHGNVGWMIGRNEMTLGIATSTWAGGVWPSSISSSKDYWRNTFIRRGKVGYSGQFLSLCNYYVTSTDSRNAWFLFRIRNTTPNTINWQPKFYYTSCGSWGEYFGVALNGQNIVTQSSNCGNCKTTANMNIPPNRVSSVIITVTEHCNSDSMRCIQFGAYDDSLMLPEGLLYVDDLDTATGGYDQ